MVTTILICLILYNSINFVDFITSRISSRTNCVSSEQTRKIENILRMTVRKISTKYTVEIKINETLPRSLFSPRMAEILPILNDLFSGE